MKKIDYKEYLNSTELYEYDNERFLEFVEKIKFDYKRPYVLVSGTAGKSSVVNFLTSIYTEQGLKTGTFDFNYLNDEFNKSIKINDGFVEENDINTVFAQYQKEIIKYELTKYEVMLFIALKLFDKYEIELSFIRVYKGGTFDPVNVFDHGCKLLIINNVGLEDTDILGLSRSEIAGEYAGLIKPRIPVVVNQLDEAIEVPIKEVIKKEKASLHIVSEYYKYDIIDNNLVFGYFPYENIVIPNEGLYQRLNLASVFEAINILKDEYPLDEEKIRKALSKKLDSKYYSTYNVKDKKIIIDSAANPSQLAVVTKSFGYNDKGFKNAVLVALDYEINAEKYLSLLSGKTELIRLTTYNDNNARDEEGFALFVDDYEFNEDFADEIDNLLDDERINRIIIVGSKKFIILVAEHLDNSK